jgi:hypothetical protein
MNKGVPEKCEEIACSSKASFNEIFPKSNGALMNVISESFLATMQKQLGLEWQWLEILKPAVFNTLSAAFSISSRFIDSPLD